MSKTRKNISLPNEVNEAIPASDNYSNKVAQWTRQYYLEGNFYNVERAMLEGMLDTVEDSRQRMHDEIDEMHDEMAAEIQARIEHLDQEGFDEDRQNTQDAKLEEAKDVLENATRSPENEAIKNWARKLNMTPKELVEELPPRKHNKFESVATD